MNSNNNFMKVDFISTDEILKLMVKKNYSNFSINSVDGNNIALALKEQNFSKVDDLGESFSFEKLMEEITKLCSFSIPNKYPQDGKIIWKIGSQDYKFLVNFFTLEGNGKRLDFFQV